MFSKVNGVVNDIRPRWDDVLPVPKLRFSVASVLVFCLAVLCFANSYDGEFVFDDYFAITTNKDVLPETPLSTVFAHDFWGAQLEDGSHKSYRPLTVMTFRWSYSWAGGLHPRGFHVVNIVLHGLVSVIFLAVFSVLMSGYQVDQESARPVFASPRAALLCAVLFAVHPVHTESVAGVVGRADLLCALTFLLSFLLYARACLSSSCLVSYCSESFSLVSILASMCLCFVSYRPESFSLVSILASMCLCVVSTFCKEQGITVIGVCSVFDVIVVCRVDPFRWLGLKKQDSEDRISNVKKQRRPYPWLKALVTRQLILFLTGISLIVSRLWITGSAPTFLVKDNPHSFVEVTFYRALNYNYLYAINTWLLLNPWWLCCDWSMGCIPVITSLADPRILADVLLWAGFGVLAFHCYHGQLTNDRRILIMSLAVLGVPFLPASNLFFRVGFVIAERILYLSCAGFCMLVVLGVRQICLHAHSTTKKLQLRIGELNDALNNKDFAVEKYRLTMTLNPPQQIAMINLAAIMKDRGNVHEAEQLLERAVNVSSSVQGKSWTDKAMTNLALIRMSKGDNLGAERLLEGAVSLRSDNTEAMMNLGVVRAKMKKNALAEASFLQSIQHNQTCSDCYYNLGNLYRDAGRSDEAIRAWQNATTANPAHVSAWRNHLFFLHDLGRYELAIAVGKDALKALPGDTDLMFHLANTYIMVDKFQESEDLFLAGLQIDPHSAKFHHNLGVLYHRWGKNEKAEAAFTRAVELNPGDATYVKNLQLLQKKMGKLSKA
ncbi:protein O-mannosyl-transferase TMTC4-like [Haliotis rubra]|uniref:protein O-mannosyl-transferase TMTC4-like n=1 Tax=Haliotis rubra TaxID=36100 RepID=UPI001EE5963B|nr:protein O-mannosyl-transferase TMTC4-like [Haliotis rubra]